MSSCFSSGHPGPLAVCCISSLQVAHRPLDAIQQELLKPVALPDRLFMTEGGVKSAALAYAAGPGQRISVESLTHPGILHVHGRRIEFQEDVGSLGLEVAHLVDF